MKLSAAYLLEELKKNYPIYTPEHLSLQPELGRPVFCTGATVLDTDRIYITEDPSLIPITDPGALFFSDRPGSSPFPSPALCLYHRRLHLHRDTFQCDTGYLRPG